MITEYIDVDGYWGVIICYDYDLDYIDDREDLWGYFRSFGMSDESARKALRILEDDNTGMCISNNDVRMSGIFVSRTTSPSEFWDTLIHEIRHAADAIIDYYGADWNEDAAYTTGFLTRRAVELLGEPCVF